MLLQKLLHFSFVEHRIASQVSNEKLILDDIPTIKVHDTKLVEHLSHNRQSESGANNKREFQIPLHLLQSGSSARMRLSQRKQSTRRAEEGGTRGATSTDLMASMVNGFTSLTNFKFSGEKAESEDEVHNAWGDEDTADDFGNRVYDLQEARGITLGPAPSAARARRAQRKQKQKPGEMDQASTCQSTLKRSDSGANNKHEFQIPLHLLQSGSSARMRLSQRKQSTRRAEEEEGGTRGATSTDLMASMVNGFTSLTNFKFSGEKAESEDEVHNAWGDEDTADDFGNRVHDLQEARGITLGPAPSAARARRAQRKQKQKPEEVCARQSSLVANDHSNSNIAGPDRQTFFAASGVVTSLLSNLSMSMSISGTAENVKDNAKYPEAEQQSGMAMPMLTSHSLGRERYARRKGKLDSTALPQGTLSPFVSAGVESASSSASVALSDASSLVRLGRRRANPPGFAEAADSFVVYGTNHGSSFLAAATSSLVAFQRLFQTEDEETYSIWGPDDTPEQYQQRLTALERARGEPNASMLHHRLMRRRKKRQQVSHGTQDIPCQP